jgi:hypothetical protein
VEKILIRLYLFIKIIKNIILIRGDYFRFGLVFIKKNNQTEFFLKKSKPNRNRFKPTGFGLVQFGFLGKNWFKPVLARFLLGLAPFFSGLVQFF